MSTTDHNCLQENSKTKRKKGLHSKYLNANKTPIVINKIDNIKHVKLDEISDVVPSLTNNLSINQVIPDDISKSVINISSNVSNTVKLIQTSSLDDLSNPDSVKSVKVTKKIDEIQLKELDNNSYITQTGVIGKNNVLRVFIKMFVEYVLSVISKRRLLTDNEIFKVKEMFKLNVVINTIYLVTCYIIENVINFVYNKLIKSDNNISTELDSDLLFENKDYVNLNCYHFINTDDKLSSSELESFVDSNAEDLLISEKDKKLRSKAVELLNGTLDSLFDHELINLLDRDSNNQDIDKSIIELAIELDKNVLAIFDKKRDSGYINQFFNISVNLRFTISYLAASCIYRLVKSTVHLLMDISFSRATVNILLITIHNFFTNSKDVNSDILYKKFIDYIRSNKLKTI